MTDVEFIKRKMAKSKNEKTRKQYESILINLDALEIIKNHIIVQIIPIEIEKNGKYHIYESYRSYNKRLEEGFSREVMKWIVQNIDKEVLDKLYEGNLRDKFINYDIRTKVRNKNDK